MSSTSAPELRVVTVGIDDYSHFATLDKAEEQAQSVAGAFGDRAETLVVPAGGWVSILQGLQTALPRATSGVPGPNGLLIYWAGHGYLQEQGNFALAASDTDPDETAMITPATIADLAARTGVARTLLVIDACFSAAGALTAIARAIGIIKEQGQFRPGSGWFGVLASAMDWQTARDDLFGPRFLTLLQSGPSAADLQEHWNAYNRQISGESLIEAVYKDWSWPPDQKPDSFKYGEDDRFLPNLRWSPLPAGGVPAHLIDAASGGEGGDGGFFTGRTRLLNTLVELVREPQPGMHVVIGPPGCGKSAVLGWLAARSDPELRATIKCRDDVADPELGSVTASLVAHGLSAKQLVNAVDHTLSNGFLPTDRAGRRGIGELLDAITATGRCPVVIVDGLDEAGVDDDGLAAWSVVQDVLRPLATVASVIVGTRERAAAVAPANLLELGGTPVTPDLRSTSLVAALTTDASRIYAIPELVDESADIEGYVAARLTGIDPTMDPAAVAAYVNETQDADVEGGFLFARLLTDWLRQFPVDTHLPDWQEQLANSVEDSFDRTIADLPPSTSRGTVSADAVKDLLVALAWAFGAGMPDDVWVRVATALSVHGARYDRADVARVLETAGRFVVEDGNGTQAVYRLSHQRLVEHLAYQTFDDAAVRVAEAVRGLLLDWVQASRDFEAHTYLWQHGWQHCAQAGATGIELLRTADAQTDGLFRVDLALALDAFSEQLAEAEDESALSITQQAVELLGEIDDEDLSATLIAGLTRLAVLHVGSGQLAEAAATGEEAVRIARRQDQSTTSNAPMLADTLRLHATTLRLGGRSSEAIDEAEDSVRIYRSLVQSSADYRFDLASALTEVGLANRDAGQPDRALRAIREATQIFGDLAATNPDFRDSYATSLSNLALVNRDSGYVSAALQPALDAVALKRTLVAEDAEAEPSLAAALSNLGLIYRELGRPADAVEPLAEAVRRSEHHLDTEPAAPFVLALNNLAVSLRDVGRPAEALVPAERAVSVGLQAVDEPDVQPHVALALGNLALLQVEAGDLERGIRLAREAISRYDALFSAGSVPMPSLLDGAARTTDSLGQFLLGQGSADVALPFAERSLSLYEKLAEINRTARPFAYLAQAHLGLVYAGLGRQLDAVRTTQLAQVQARTYLDSLPSEDRSPTLRAQLATVITCAALVMQPLDPSLALPLAEEAAQLYRSLVEGQPVYRDALVEVLVLWSETLAKTNDPSAASTTPDELARELQGLLGEGEAGRLRIAAALARVATAMLSAGDGAGSRWAEQAAALLPAEPAAEPTADQHSALLSTRAAVLLSQALAANQANQHAAAITAAEESVEILRSFPQPAVRLQRLLVALVTLARIARAGGDRQRAAAAAEEAIELVRPFAPSAIYLRTRGQTTALLSWARADPDLPRRVYEELPDDASRVGLLLVSLATDADTVTTEQLVAAEDWMAGAAAELLLSWREHCRRRRAQQPEAFDAAWLARHTDVPAWLQLDPKLVRLVIEWMNLPSIPETYEFHRRHAEELADPAVDTLLTEIAMANPNAPHYLELARDAADVGVDDAYAPWLLGALVDQLQSVDLESWPRLLAEHRDLLQQPNLLDPFVSDLAANDSADQLLAAALLLAAQDKDAAVLAAAKDPDRVADVLTELADDPQLTCQATFLLLNLDHLGPAETNRVRFARVLALARLDRLTEATSLAGDVAAAEPESKAARLHELIQLAPTVPQVGPLLPIFAA